MKVAGVVAPPNYIDLNRKFSPVRQDAASEESALQNYAFGPDWHMQRNALAWDDILKRPLVVILGEPGSGKTYEMQVQAARPSPSCRVSTFVLMSLRRAVLAWSCRVMTRSEWRNGKVPTTGLYSFSTRLMRRRFTKRQISNARLIVSSS